LGLAGNLLAELPEGIGNLQQLEGLWVHGNVLHSLPPQVRNHDYSSENHVYFHRFYNRQGFKDNICIF